MPKRIKNVSELPNWFQLKKYDKAKALDTTGWYEQLSVRNSAYLITTWFNDPENHKKEIEGMPDFGDVMELIRQNPIVDVMSDELLKSYFSGKPLTELKPKNPCYSRGVRSVTGKEFSLLLHSLGSKRVKFLMERSSYLTRLLSPLEKWLDEPLHEHPSFNAEYLRNIVFINWELPDAVLTEHFKQFLKTNRQEYYSKYWPIGLMTQPRKLNIKNWHELAVLPYLDLMIWQEEAKVSIPNRVMANAIYPPGEYGEETVRKTTAALAEDLIFEQSLELLASQAAFEIMEENSK